VPTRVFTNDPALNIRLTRTGTTLDAERPAGALSRSVSRGDGNIYRRKGSSHLWIQYNVRGRTYREPGGKTEDEARRKLRRRLREAGSERFAGPAAERVTVDQLADALLVHMTNQGRASLEKIRSHLKPVRAFFSLRRAMDVTTAALERYQRERLEAGMAPATVNREVHALRRAFNVAAQQTPPLFPKHLVPYFPSLPVDNVRTGFFELAEVEALLAHVADPGIRDFIEWGFRTGMRKGEIARMTWEMLDRSASPWVLRVPGSITKNRTGRTLGLEGDVRAIMERRLRLPSRLPADLPSHVQGEGRAADHGFLGRVERGPQGRGAPGGAALSRPASLRGAHANPGRRRRDDGDESLGPQDALDAAPLQHRDRARNGRRPATGGPLSLDATAYPECGSSTVVGQCGFRRR
jgi:integrase